MKVLLVEDDARIAQFLLRGLIAEGYVLDWEKDDIAGYAVALRKAHDVIVLDLMLPGMDGREVCTRLRADGITTKILMLTALETTSDVVKGLRMGADDYLTNPFAFDELTARLEALTRNVATVAKRAPQVLQVGDLVFDTDALVVGFAGATIEVTSLEYALLQFLMAEQGKVVTRARILRAKLSGAGAPDMISTVRGRGYRLD